MNFRAFGLICVLLAACFPATAPAQNYGPQQQAQQLCSVVVGTLAFGQYNPQQVFGRSSLQVIMQVTNGTGIFQPLQQMGQVTQLSITNPHYDQDQQYGQLFHFYCTSVHQQGAVNWEIKYAPGTNMIEYVTLQHAQQPGPGPQPSPQPQFPQPGPQPQFPQQPGQQPQFPQQPGPQQPSPQPEPNPQPQPQPQPTPGPQPGSEASKDEACKMFPGMC